MSEELRRRYELLLLAYPRWYRRERGTELLTTLLDDAAEGQRRPRRADALDLIAGGLLTRLRPPRGSAARLLTAVCALYAALAGMALAVLAGPYPGPPAAQDALAAATTAFGRAPQGAPGLAVDCDLACPDVKGAHEMVVFDHSEDRTDTVVVWADPAVADLAQAQARLAAAGWSADPVVGEVSGLRSFDAVRDGLSLSVSLPPPTESDARAVLVVSKRPTASVVTAALAGALAGAAVGWLAVVWALQRRRRHGPALRLASALAGAPFALVATVTLGYALLWAVTPVLTGAPVNAVAVPLALLTLLPAVTVAAAGSAVLCCALLALPGRGAAAALGRRLA
ncbi:hypothetical protein [Catellatospora vulcania]|uniref:hypothetical protein n=1 Tax=Catellatospora vulcania TaxID=1460450 RepID=UPI0012D3BD25|nr:hypothetical protein [Catellatospora vulcania]